MTTPSSGSLILPCSPVVFPELFHSSTFRGNYFKPPIPPATVLISKFLVSYFIEKIEAVKREFPLAPTAYQSFFLTVFGTANELFMFLLSRAGLTCTVEVIPSSLSKDLLPLSSLLSTLHFSSPLHHYYCNLSHLKNKNQTWSHIPLHLHSYFFDPLKAKQYSPIVAINWL